MHPPCTCPAARVMRWTLPRRRVIVAGQRPPARQLRWCSRGSGGGMWEKISVSPAQKPEEREEEDADTVPRTFREYVQYCKIIGALDVPDLLLKEGVPETTRDVVGALEGADVMHLLGDDAFYYLIIAGWMPEMESLHFRVFQHAERERLWKEMMRVLKGAEDQWGPKTSAALLHCASTLGFTEKAVALYQEANNKGHLTRYSFPSVMYALGRGKDLDRASEIFRWVEDRGARGEDYKAFIFANSKVGNWRDARYFYEQYKKRRPDEPPSKADEKLMTTLLAAYSRGKNTKGTMELYKEITAKYTPTDYHTSCAIAAHANGSIKGYNVARMLFLRSYDLTRTSSANAWMKVMIRLFASLYRVAGEPRDEVERVLESTVFSHQQIARFAGRKAGHLAGRFWKLYDIMHRFPTHYRPDAITFFHCLQFAKLSRNPERATTVLRDAENAGYQHTAYYNLAIAAHSRVSDVAGGFALFKEMRSHKLTPNIGSYSALVESLGPGQGTNNTISILDTIKRSNLEPSGTLLAGCIRVFGSSAGVLHLVDLCRTAVSLSSGDMLVADPADSNAAAAVSKTYVLDNPWLWFCLERPLRDESIMVPFSNDYPDFSERCFEVVAAPLLSFRAPRDTTATLEDMKHHFTVTPGKSVWVLTDEWMLPLGGELREYIQDAIEAKDRIIIPFYCLVRLGKLVRHGFANIQQREAAFKVMMVLQDLFDESAAAAARGEKPIVDTVYFNEQLHAYPMFEALLEKQDTPEQDKETEKLLSNIPVPFDLELEFATSINKNVTIRSLSRRSVAVAALLRQFQTSQRTQVYFCARNSEHLRLAKKVGLEVVSVEDALGPDWLKHRIIEDEKLMLSWKAETLTAIGEREEIPALTASSYADNKYLQPDAVQQFSLEHQQGQNEPEIASQVPEQEMPEKFVPRQKEKEAEVEDEETLKTLKEEVKEEVATEVKKEAKEEAEEVEVEKTEGEPSQAGTGVEEIEDRISRVAEQELPKVGTSTQQTEELAPAGGERWTTWGAECEPVPELHDTESEPVPEQWGTWGAECEPVSDRQDIVWDTWGTMCEPAEVEGLPRGAEDQQAEVPFVPAVDNAGKKEKDNTGLQEQAGVKEAPANTSAATQTSQELEDVKSAGSQLEEPTKPSQKTARGFWGSVKVNKTAEAPQLEVADFVPTKDATAVDEVGDSGLEDEKKRREVLNEKGSVAEKSSIEDPPPKKKSGGIWGSVKVAESPRDSELVDFEPTADKAGSETSEKVPESDSNDRPESSG